jgi:hypothetical protein
MKLPTNRDGKPVLDEASFQKLLAAAYVLQQHQERTRAAEEASRAAQQPDPAYAQTLAEIVEIQQQISMRRLDLDAAVGFVVEQTQRITSAAGVAVALLDHDHLVYRAVTGRSVAEMGSALPKERALSANVLAHGMVLRCVNTRNDPNVDATLINGAGIASFIALPIFHDDKVDGVLEIVFDKVQGFSSYDVHTGQMMAGLVTEALARTEDEKWKRSLTAERDSMLQALEKLKPQLDRLAKDAEHLSSTAVPDFARKEREPWPTTTPTARTEPRSSARAIASTETECHKCGNHLGDQEVYCGSCGTLRSERPINGQRAAVMKPSFDESPLDLDGNNGLDLRPLSERMAKPEFDLPPEVLALVKEEQKPEATPDVADELLKLLPPENWEGQAQQPPTPATTPNGYPWTSAANAREWLNSMSDPKSGANLMEFVRVHRGDISLVAAILLVLVAIFWTRTDHTPVAASPSITTSVNAPVDTNARSAAPSTDAEVDPQSQLSFWDRTLIALGLAEAPATPTRPQALGNPEARVWVDLHTALYYCPGTDLYGKTPKGRYTTQREAQSERFEPASSKVCE